MEIVFVPAGFSSWAAGACHRYQRRSAGKRRRIQELPREQDDATRIIRELLPPHKVVS